MERYVFFDRTIALTLPPDLTTQWDLLYGAFRAETEGAVDLRVSCSDTGGDMAELDVGGRTRSIPRETALLHLQDLVQNHVLPAVQSRLLWHGAAWQVNGRGVMILGESGLGKTTLSLAEQLDGGRVLSDELAVWNPESSLLESFPRSMAVRPHSLRLLDCNDSYPHLIIDEEKAMVPLKATRTAGIRVGGLCILNWPEDEDARAGGFYGEFRVVSPTTHWRERLLASGEAITLAPHPDGQSWWRYHAPERISVQTLESVVRESGGLVTDYHPGARRMPDHEAPPRWTPLDGREAAEAALAYLINARIWTTGIGPARLMGMVRALTQRVKCARCVPGRVSHTRAAIHTLA